MVKAQQAGPVSKVRLKAAHAAGASWMKLECGMLRCVRTFCRGIPAGPVAVLDLAATDDHDAVTWIWCALIEDGLEAGERGECVSARGSGVT